jgi:hypothetical protein
VAVAILVKEQSLPIDQETFNGALLLRVRWQVAATPHTILGAYLGSSAEENLSNTVIISAGRTQRMRIDENGDTEFYGKVTSESTEASDSDTTLVTKDYVDGLKTIYVDGLGGTTFATVNFILQYSNSSATLTADGGDIAITSNSIVYRKSAAGRVMPELKVGDQVRVVKPNGDVHIRQVTNVDGLFGDFFIVGAAEISSGVSLTVGEFYDFNFMFK